MDDCDVAEEVGAVDDGLPRRGLITRSRLALAAIALVALWYLFNLVDVWIGATSDYDGIAPAAVVLGAAQYNGSPSAALAGRLDRAGELYLDDRVELVVVTGGGQEADITTEAKTGYDYLREDHWASPTSDLRLEVQGASTYESLAATEPGSCRPGGGRPRWSLVTDRYPRSAGRSARSPSEVGLECRVVSLDPLRPGSACERLMQESAAVSIGRILGFRPVDAYLGV